jgi:3-phenylpropionate/trans-cinnamate dioxygenase ferredoxin reductase component
MPHYHYLIVGGGMTADAVIRGIREADSDGSIELVGAETERPYNRPPLSKGLWKGKAIDSIWRGTDATDAALHLGRTVVHLDPPNRTVVDDQAAEYTYDQLLLATGGTPRRLPSGGDHILIFPHLAGITSRSATSPSVAGALPSLAAGLSARRSRRPWP